MLAVHTTAAHPRPAIYYRSTRVRDCGPNLSREYDAVGLANQVLRRRGADVTEALARRVLEIATALAERRQLCSR